jgi:purine-nucleoside phosphorylase
MSKATIDRARAWKAEIAIVTGSGLSSLAANATAETIPYAEIEGLPRSTVSGHVGRFALGRISGVPVIFGQGRVHLYEGYTAQQVTAAIRFLAQAGIKQLILSNAAGAVNDAFAPGSWMMVADHLNLTGVTPLVGSAEFVDMSGAYSVGLREQFRQTAKAAGIRLHEGIYAGLPGPQYETPAEVRMLRTLGADAVGMSTVLETIQARALGLEVAAFSCLTNAAAGLSAQLLSHSEVLQVGQAAAADFARLLTAFFQARSRA